MSSLNRREDHVPSWPSSSINDWHGGVGPPVDHSRDVADIGSVDVVSPRHSYLQGADTINIIHVRAR